MLKPAIAILTCVLATLCSGPAFTQAADADKPLASLPYSPSLDVASMDKSVDPCDDLYTYSCGGWKKNNPIPADQAAWGVYSKVTADNQRFLWGVLQDAAKASPTRSANQQKIGDYFAACMDEAAIERKGISPLQPDLDRIGKITSAAELPALLASLQSHIFSPQFLFGAGVQQDAQDASLQIAGIYAGGLGLPDRDYYFKDDEKSKKTRERYQQYIAEIMQLAGDDAQQAAAAATTVMRIETHLAQARLTRVEQRDPYAVYHRTTEVALAKMTPHFDWAVYLKTANIQPGAWLNVSQPKFLAAVDEVIAKESLDDIKTYLRWGLVNSQASALSKPFVDANFGFYSAYLRGVEKQRPRWKRCVSLVDRDLGEALGKEFVERTFPASVKTATAKMTSQIETAMRTRIEHLDWMSAETKAKALAKLEKMRNKVGYPDMWRDYGKLAIERGDFYGNLGRAVVFEKRRQIAKIGKPVDRSEWGMTPPTVNAYYDPQMNDINFPAAVLLPPLYDAKMDDAPNYGNTGGTIGHELTHGFDDEGRQYDGDGNLRDWWTKKDAAAFEKGAQCIRDQYAQYTIVDDIKINSKLTAGEDIADLGGLIIAWVAWQEQTKGMKLASQDGLTPEQRFFVGFAQWACSNERPENQRVNALTDPHSPDKYRINGVAANMPEFARAFQCKTGKALVKPPKDVCRIW